MGSTSSPIGKRNHSKLHELILNFNRNSLSFKFEISSSISSAKRSKISKKLSQNPPKSKQNQAQVAPKSLQMKSSKNIILKINQKIIPKCPKGHQEGPKSLPIPLEIDEKLIQKRRKKQHDFHSPFLNDLF